MSVIAQYKQCMGPVSGKPHVHGYASIDALWSGTECTDLGRLCYAKALCWWTLPGSHIHRMPPHSHANLR